MTQLKEPIPPTPPNQPAVPAQLNQAGQPGQLEQPIQGGQPGQPAQAAQSDPPAQPTQIRHPWRATLRTVIAAIVAGLTLLPEIASEAHIGSGPTVVQVVAVSATITRILAIPGVNAWLATYAPWLAAAPPN